MRRSLTHVLSILYAWILILVGVVFSSMEALRGTWATSHVVAVYNLFLELVASAFLIYMQVYHLQWKTKKKSHSGHGSQNSPDHQTTQSEVLVIRRTQSRLSMSASNGSIQPTTESGLHVNSSTVSPNPARAISIISRNPTRSSSIAEMGKLDSSVWDAEAEADEEEEIEEYITLHSGMVTVTDDVTSFYLRLGVLVFAIGNLLYLGLQIENNQGQYSHCYPDEIDYQHYFHLLFVIVQTFFLFKHSKLARRKHRGLVHFGVTHVLATNMCIWVRVLVFEVMEAIHANNGDGHSITPMAAEDVVSNDTDCPSSTLLHEASPYLFPFVLEYSLIGAATMACMYEALNLKIGKDIIQKIHNAVLRSRSRQKSGGSNTRRVHHHHHHHLPHPHHHRHEDEDDLAKSHIGMFLGLLVFTGCIISIVLYFYWYESGSLNSADLALVITDLVNNILLLTVTIYSIRRLNAFSYSDDDNNTIDHALLLVAYAGLFLLELFTLVMSSASIDGVVSVNRALHIVNCVLSIIQGTVQSIHIIDGMQRYVLTTSQLNTKPARGAITYLIFANVSTWLFKTIQEKKLFQTDGTEYYGATAWAILLNITLPLQLFFRFHSSICLAHMWHSLYHPRDPLVIDDAEEMEPMSVNVDQTSNQAFMNDDVSPKPSTPGSDRKITLPTAVFDDVFDRETESISSTL